MYGCALDLKRFGCRILKSTCLPRPFFRDDSKLLMIINDLLCFAAVILLRSSVEFGLQFCQQLLAATAQLAWPQPE